MHEATAAVAATPLVWGPFTSALFVDPAAFDGLYSFRTPEEAGTGEKVFRGPPPEDVFREVSPALSPLLPKLDEKGFAGYRLGDRFRKIEKGEGNQGDFFDTFGKSLAVFGNDHPDAWRAALREAFGRNVYPELHVTAENLDAFVLLTNWMAKKERTAFWRRVHVEGEEKEAGIHESAAWPLSGGISFLILGVLIWGFYNFQEVPREAPWVLQHVGWMLALLGVVAVGVGAGRFSREVNRLNKLLKEIVSPEVSPVFPELLPAESRHDPNVVGKLFSGQIQHWIHLSLRGGDSVR